MTDRYARIREALAMGPTPGPWSVYEHRAHWTSFMIMRGGSVRNQLAQFFNWQDRGFDVNAEKNAKFVAACDPDTIRALLEERDALQAEIEALRAEVDALRKALARLITWIPSADTYRRLGFDPDAPMRVLEEARAALAHGGEG